MENQYDSLEKAVETGTIRELCERKSVRVFTDQPIKDCEKHQILYAAMQAPSAGCQQLYTILDITDQKIRDQLSVTCNNQPFIATAPMVLVFCAACKKWLDCYREAKADPREPGVGDLMLAVTDTAIAAQNAVTAAWSLGIGSCYIGDIMERYEQQREILHLPDYVFPAAMAVFGYPAQSQKDRIKPQRFDPQQIVFENAYPEQSDCLTLLNECCGSQDYDSWVRQFCARKYNSDFSREMTRSVEQYLKQYSAISQYPSR